MRCPKSEPSPSLAVQMATALRSPTMAGTILLRTAYLVAPDSPRQAFYHLWLEQTPHTCRVVKASGAGGRVWHRQVWEFATLAEAEKLFLKRLREKTNPARRSPRKYGLLSLPSPVEATEYSTCPS
ncbi:MAG: hypothetical protein ACUVRZ_09635 [Desulfobacca sp.]|uniref:hypothetical protein n=1 Tax=Desulfobacca sp. TaxID=2067990 RepID=UPI0040493387